MIWSPKATPEGRNALGMAGISKSQVSRLCEEIDERVSAFLDRPIEGDWPYLWIDATYVKVRQNGRIVSVAVGVHFMRNALAHDRLKLTPKVAVAQISYTTRWDTIDDSCSPPWTRDRRVFIATADRQNACPQDVVKLVRYPGGIAPVGNAGGQSPADSHGTLSLRQQQHAAIRGQPTTVKRSCKFLASDRWKRNRGGAIIDLGGCGLWHFMPRCRLV